MEDNVGLVPENITAIPNLKVILEHKVSRKILPRRGLVFRVGDTVFSLILLKHASPNAGTIFSNFQNPSPYDAPFDCEIYYLNKHGQALRT